MISDIKLQFLDELTDRERSIFLYCFVFKVPKKETSRHLKVSLKELNGIYKDILDHITINRIQSRLLELHDMV